MISILKSQVKLMSWETVYDLSQDTNTIMPLLLPKKKRKKKKEEVLKTSFHKHFDPWCSGRSACTVEYSQYKP